MTYLVDASPRKRRGRVRCRRQATFRRCAKVDAPRAGRLFVHTHGIQMAYAWHTDAVRMAYAWIPSAKTLNPVTDGW